MFLLIDNYDSFTYNLVQAFYQLGRNPVVVKNDDPALLKLVADPALAMVCISPGPGRPENAGLCLEFMRHLPVSIPVLGVCLGHQILGHFAGAEVYVADEIMHGKQSEVYHNTTGIFCGLASPMAVGRYHSLLVRANDVPEKLAVTARTATGEVMAFAYTDRPWVGVQFHPESVLTPEGLRLLANFPSGLLAGANGLALQSPIQMEGNLFAKSTGAGIVRTPEQMPVIIEALAKRQNLSTTQACEAFTRLMEGELSPSQAGALLLGLRAKGETPEEIGEAVKATLAKAVPVPPVSGVTIDIVGTGGDNKSSFNCSTATSLILAGMGRRVLKHGNRSVSSRCGSADVLEALGIPLDTPPENVPSVLDKEGFVFLFAPRYHPSFRHVMPVRRELGVRTLFNILGPLVNPARPTHHLFGVADKGHLSLVAETLARSEGATGIVVYGAGGYDEATPLGESHLVFVKAGTTRLGRLNPAEYGFNVCSEADLAVEGPEHATAVMRLLLQGKGAKAMLDMITLNLALALYLLGLDKGEEKVDEDCGYDKLRMSQAMLEAKNAVVSGAGRRFCNA